MNTYTPSEHEINENRVKVIYEAVEKIESRILTELDLDPQYFYIGGMHLSQGGKTVELDIYGEDDRYVTDTYEFVSSVMEAAQ